MRSMSHFNCRIPRRTCITVFPDDGMGSVKVPLQIEARWGVLDDPSTPDIAINTPYVEIPYGMTEAIGFHYHIKVDWPTPRPTRPHGLNS